MQRGVEKEPRRQKELVAPIQQLGADISDVGGEQGLGLPPAGCSLWLDAIGNMGDENANPASSHRRDEAAQAIRRGRADAARPAGITAPGEEGAVVVQQVAAV